MAQIKRTHARTHEELKHTVNKLNKRGRSEVKQYAQVLIFSQELKIDPITAEQWQRVPGWLKWKIFLTLLWYTWESSLAEIGLKLGGIK
jgi:hypothetical protein